MIRGTVKGFPGLRKRGGRVSLAPRHLSVFVGRFPFHDDQGRPNLIVFLATQTWCCFACGAQGDVVDFVARMEGVSIREAIERLREGVPEARRVGEPVTRGPVATASPETRDAAYRALIASETLSFRHREMLEKRGFPVNLIDRNGYRTHVPGRAPSGVSLAGVPGFYQEGGVWRVEGPTGLLVLVRDPEGRIVGCQVRADDAKAGKYRWLASARRTGGTSSGAPCHYAPGDGGPNRQVWVTEGPLKADLAADRLGMPVLGVAGVANWRGAVMLGG